MSLSLPADVEPFAPDFDAMHRPGCYALDLARPDDPAAAWDQRYDTRPEWFPTFQDASEVVYVGASGDVLSRLEDHRNGEVRQAALVRVCDVTDVRGVWWMDSTQDAFDREHGIAMSIQNAKPSAYVHAR